MLAVAKTSVAFRSMWRRNELRVANNDAALSWRWKLTHSHRHVFRRCYEDINICELSKALKCGPHIPPLILVQGRVKKNKNLSTKHLLPIKKGATVKALQRDVYSPYWWIPPFLNFSTVPVLMYWVQSLSWREKQVLWLTPERLVEFCWDFHLL